MKFEKREDVVVMTVINERSQSGSELISRISSGTVTHFQYTRQLTIVFES